MYPESVHAMRTRAIQSSATQQRIAQAFYKGPNPGQYPTEELTQIDHPFGGGKRVKLECRIAHRDVRAGRRRSNTCACGSLSIGSQPSAERGGVGSYAPKHHVVQRLMPRERSAIGKKKRRGISLQPRPPSPLLVLPFWSQTDRSGTSRSGHALGDPRLVIQDAACLQRTNCRQTQQ